MGQSPTLRAKISRDIFRLFGSYIIGVTLTCTLLAIYGIIFYQQEEFGHYKALISTRLGFEIGTSFKEATDLADSTVIWTGLTDSVENRSYLQPLLEKANRNDYYKLDLLDYRGRFLIQGSNAKIFLLGMPESVKKTIKDSQIHLELISISQTDLLIASLPIKANFSDSNIGLVLINIDLIKIMSTLNFPNDLVISYSFTPFENNAIDFFKHSETLKIEMHDAGKDSNIYVRLQQSYFSAFIFVMTGLGASLTFGLLLLIGLRRWTRIFSEQTTQRLDELVQVASDTVEGRDTGHIIQNTGDEISKVSNVLKSMLEKQRLATQEKEIFARVFETAAEAILITNQQGLVVDVNTALTNMTGYEKKELINQHAGLLYNQNDKDIGFSNIAEAVRKEGAWRGETYFLSKQQSLLPVLLSVSTLLDAQGVIQGHVSVFSDIRAIREAENKLQELLIEDFLTGLPNYRGFLDYIKKKAAGDQFAIVFIDLDNFKIINDTYGHDQGDDVIGLIAQHLKLRLPVGTFLCRRSGDEFIAVLDIHEPIADFMSKLELIFKPAIFSINEGDAVQITATFSVGVAMCPEHSQSISELLIYADTALLHAKELGRNQVKRLNAEMIKAAIRKTKIGSNLPAAIRNGLIYPSYQPEVELRSGKIIGFEALARWNDKELGIVSPAEFIPVAEQSGDIDLLTQSLFSQIIKDSLAIRAHFPGSTIALNSSPQLLSGKRILTMLSNLALELEKGLDGFVLEITETDFSLNPQEVAIQLRAIMDLGVRIAIDDFGKSYSSLSRLASMPIQKLKIDMSFTSGMVREENIKIISGILALSQSLNLEVTAEGVENSYQQDTLIRLGCLQAQGYFFSKPLKLKDLLELPTHLQTEKSF